jgi:hypothetical protein
MARLKNGIAGIKIIFRKEVVHIVEVFRSPLKSR